MKTFVLNILVLSLLGLQSFAQPQVAGKGDPQQRMAGEPIQLHPNNPHYFFWHGKPTVLITSGEHYGSVLNAGFDYVKYLDTLAADGLNLTRTFTGAYCENPTAFNITSNTLAPATGRLLCPWARSDTPRYANGGNKFDLSKWDDAYFRRLKDFVVQASTRGVVVELALFCPFYRDDMWNLSPMNAANNINSIGSVSRTNVYTLDEHGGLLAVQEAMVRKLVTELRGADNVMWEICNEPYFGGVTMEWQHHIADVIVDAEKSFPARHLITQNIANGRKKIESPHPAVSVFNFHYASPPDTVPMNFALNKVIGDNETGFKGTNDAHYRMEAWEFILAGGALYNNLDYSFTVGHEDGTFVYPPKQPGGGNPTFRKQMKVLKDFMNSFDFVRMKADKSFIKSPMQEGQRVSAMSEPGRQYALYFNGGTEAALTLDLPKGNYKVEWICELTGECEQHEELKHAGGEAVLLPKKYKNEIALRIKSVE
ncbi:MAG: hypothetical protein HY300_17760 [Verrucomicrobia bacterium]|nr:hypothetical protein [Verrucomicrobiota bacterium]